jgi:hypothetical protein
VQYLVHNEISVACWQWAQWRAGKKISNLVGSK